MVKRSIALTALIALSITILPSEVLAARQFKSAKGTFRGERQHQIRKKSNVRGGATHREALKKKNKLSKAEKKGLTASEIRELQEAQIVKLQAEKKSKKQEKLAKLEQSTEQRCVYLIDEDITGLNFYIDRGEEYKNWSLTGMDEKWVLEKSSSDQYFITKDGNFYRWNKSPQGDKFVTGDPIARFPQSFYKDLTLLEKWSGQVCEEEQSEETQYDRIIDNGDKNFTAEGKWKRFPLAGFEDDFAYSKENKSKAIWKFRSLKKGNYDVYVTWDYFPTLSDNAQYTIRSNGKLLSTITIDQTKAPTGLSLGGRNWQKLDTVSIKKKKNLKVVLKHNAKEFVIADAVMIQPEKTEPELPCGEVDDEAVAAFVKDGYIAEDDDCGGNGTRGALIRLDVELNGGILSTPPKTPSFDDVPLTHQYYGHIEEAAKEGWVRGDNACYGSHPCFVRPDEDMTTAAFADLIVKSFGIEFTGKAPQFIDNPSGQWYTEAIQIAADHCVLLPDEKGHVNPGEPFSFIEAINRFRRVDQGLEYGRDCGESTAETGNLYVTKSATELPDRQLLGGTLAEPIMIVDLKAEGEAIDVTTMRFELNAEEEGRQSIDRLELFKATSQEPFAIATIAGCRNVTHHMCVSMQPGVLRILKNATEVILVRPRVKTDEQGAVSDADFVATLDNDNEPGRVAIEATGVESGRALAINDNDNEAEGEVFLGTSTAGQSLDIHSTDTYIVLSKIDSITNANPDANGTFVPAGVSPVGQFKFTAAKHNNTKNGSNDVVLDALMFSVNSKNVELDASGFAFYNKADQTKKVTCIPRDLNGTPIGGNFKANTFSVDCSGLESSTADTEIDQGKDATFVLEMNIVNPQTSSFSEPQLQVSLTNFNSRGLGNFGVNGTHIKWLDRDGGDSRPFHWIEYPEDVIKSTAYGEVPVSGSYFNINIDGPATQDYTADENDAVLANVMFSTADAGADVKNLFIAIQGTMANGDNFGAQKGDIHTILEDVELRNVTTGRTIDGVRLTGSVDAGHANIGTYQIYRFDDFIVRGEERWELQVDFIDNGPGAHPRDGDQFRIIICGEPTHILSVGSLIPNAGTCDFAGLIPSTTAYQLHVEDMPTGLHIGTVRPQGDIAGNFHKMTTATLSITQKENGSSNVTVENARDITLLLFEATAGEAEDVLFTKTQFAAQVGNAKDIQNYAWWMDTNLPGEEGYGTVDTILEDGVAAQNDTITFNDPAGGGFVIPAGQTIVFEIRGDVASSLIDSKFQLRFHGVEDYIEAEELDDGSELTGIRTGDSCPVERCQISVLTAEATVWELASQGDLFMTQDSTPIRNHQYLGGTLGEPALRLEFFADKEAIDVTDLQIIVDGDIKSIDRLQLFRDGESNPFASATLGGCGADEIPVAGKTMCANMENQQLVIPADGEVVDVLVRPLFKTDEQDGVSGHAFHLEIDSTAVADDATGRGAVRARGNESSNDLVANDGDNLAEGEIFISTETAGSNGGHIGGRRNIVTMSKITSITNANPDPNGSSVPTGIAQAGQFQISAAAHVNSKNGDNDIELDGVVFNVNATNVAIAGSSFRFLNKADPTQGVTCVPYDASTNTQLSGTVSGNLKVLCDSLRDSPVSTEIDEGDSALFVLEMDITNPNTAESTGGISVLQVSLQNFDDITRDVFGIGDSTVSHIRWYDSDQSTNTEFLWIEYPETTVKSTSYNS